MSRLPLQRICPRCGHRHYATICHVCKTPAAQRAAGHALLDFLAALGLLILLLGAIAWWAREDLAAWRGSVVLLQMKCPPARAEPAR